MREEPDFCYGDALAALCGDDVVQLLPTVLKEGELAGELKGGWLLAWPDRSIGIMALVVAGSDGASNEFLVAWPFKRSGVLHRLRIDAIHQDPDSALLRLIECRWGEIRFTVFDTFCHAAVHGLATGMLVSAHVHGWARMLEPAPREPIVLLPDRVSPSMLEAFRDDFARDGKVTIETATMAAFLPRGLSPLCEIQGVVTALREEPPLLGLSLLVLTVTGARGEDGQRMDIEITATGDVWRGEWPKVGDPVRGLVWLQASFELTSTG